MASSVAAVTLRMVSPNRTASVQPIYAGDLIAELTAAADGDVTEQVAAVLEIIARNRLQHRSRGNPPHRQTCVSLRAGPRSCRVEEG